MQEKRRKRTNWGSAIGWVIFVLALAGGPILGTLRNMLGGSITLPNNLLPMIILGLVGLSVIGSAVAAIGRATRGRGDTRLPTSVAPSQPARLPQPTRQPTALPPPSGLPAGDARLPQTPRFEPIINPRVLVFGIVGALALGLLGVLLLGAP